MLSKDSETVKYNLSRDGRDFWNFNGESSLKAFYAKTGLILQINLKELKK